MNQLEQLEVTIEKHKQNIEKVEMLRRLEKNPDFIALVKEGYFKEEACRLVLTKNDPVNLNPEAQAAILRDIDAISSLADFFRSIERSGVKSIKQLADDMDSVEYYENGGE